MTLTHSLSHAPITHSPVDVVWRNAGRPDCGSKEKSLRWLPQGMCGQCRQRDGREVALAHKVLSARFGSWDDIIPTTDGVQWLCRACAWAYRDTTARRTLYRVSAEDSTPISWTSLADSLLTGQLPDRVAFSAPVGGKRIVLPRLQWGAVVSDHGIVHWHNQHAQVVRMLRSIRAAGCNEHTLLSPQAPIGVGSTPTVQAEVAQMWDALTPARRSPLWQFLVKLSRPHP